MTAKSTGGRILARTFFQQLCRAGYTASQIIGVANELLGFVISSLTEESRQGPAETANETAEMRSEDGPVQG